MLRGRGFAALLGTVLIAVVTLYDAVHSAQAGLLWQASTDWRESDAGAYVRLARSKCESPVPENEFPRLELQIRNDSSKPLIYAPWELGMSVVIEIDHVAYPYAPFGVSASGNRYVLLRSDLSRLIAIRPDRLHDGHIAAGRHTVRAIVDFFTWWEHDMGTRVNLSTDDLIVETAKQTTLGKSARDVECGLGGPKGVSYADWKNSH